MIILIGSIQTVSSHPQITLKKICVDINQKNNFFESTNITLDCNKSSLDITYLEPGQEIIFYFFKNNVLDTEVAIEKLNIVTP